MSVKSCVVIKLRASSFMAIERLCRRGRTPAEAVAVASSPIGKEARSDSLANRYSCSTSTETRDRKSFSMQLILVVGKMDMTNQIARCYPFVESYCQFFCIKK